jgi:hypothetical protein
MNISLKIEISQALFEPLTETTTSPAKEQQSP